MISVHGGIGILPISPSCGGYVGWVVLSSTQCRWIKFSHSKFGGYYQKTQQRLWQDVFSNLPERSDQRLDKRGTHYPDFKRTISGEGLWLDRSLWVNFLPGALGAQSACLRGPASFTYAESSNAVYHVQSPCYEGNLDKVLNVLCNMDRQGTVPSVMMYLSLLEACTKKKALAQAKQVHAHLAKHGYESTTCVGECVVTTLVKCGGLEDALQVFSKLLHRTVVSWTAVVFGYTQAGQYHEALRMYWCMVDEGVKPNKHTFVSLLKACGRIFDLREGKRIHGEALRHGCGSDLVVGTCLVDMYAKCGSIVDAHTVFDGLARPDTVSWSVMLGAYVQQGQSDNALHLYRQMLEEGVTVDALTLISVIQACGNLAEHESTVLVNGQSLKVESLHKGKEIHTEVQNRGCESDVFVGSTLIGMYARCGSLGDSKHVFDRLLQPNVVSWNALLAGYAQHGLGDNALQLYENMQEMGLVPDGRTFASVLQACGSLIRNNSIIFLDGQFLCAESLQMGKEIHAEAWRMGCKSDIFVGSSLISTYARCGSMKDANDVFYGLMQRDVVSWNAMLAGYAQQDRGELALQLYYQMQEVGVRQNDRTFASALQACGSLAEKEDITIVEKQLLRVESLQKGKVIHVEARRMGYMSDVFVGSTLVSMYAKCGSMKDAQIVFSGLSWRNDVCWNSIIAAYVQHGQADEALCLYEGMLKDGVSAGAWTFASALQACGSLAETEEPVLINGQAIKVESLHKGRELHAEAQRKRYTLDDIVGNTVLVMYKNCGSSKDAQNMFDDLSERVVVSWTSMLLAYADQGQVEEALELYRKMREEGVTPDAWTLASVLQACWSPAERETHVDGQSLRLDCLQKVKAIHGEIQQRGYQSDIFVGSTLIATYGKSGSIMDAQGVFDGLPQLNVVSWTSMLLAYVQQGQWEKALQLYRQMLEEGVEPDDATFVCVLQACGNAGALDTCVEVHRGLVSSGIEFNVVVATSLIHAYGRCASMVDAHTVFDTIPMPDVVTWNAMIAGHARQGDSATCLQSYEKMQVAGVEPNGVTFLSLLSGCSHCGWVDKAVEYFECMSRDYGITPEIEHYACMVDLLGRTGSFKLVKELLSQMPMPANLSIWLCLLAECRKHGHLVLGKQAFDCAVHLQPKCASAYIMMSNMYAHASMWDCAKLVDDSRQKAGAWKKPGQSWTEHKHEVLTYIAGETRHQTDKEEMFDLLRHLFLAASLGS